MKRKLWVIALILAVVFALSSGPRVAITGYYALNGGTEEGTHFGQHVKSHGHSPGFAYNGSPLMCYLYDVLVPYKEESVNSHE